MIHGPSTRGRWSVGCAALLLLSALCGSALADGDVGRQAIAERLFQEGKSAMERRQYAIACSKLEDSQRLDPAGGTVLLWSLCLEARGKLASAWLRYHEALAFARRDGREDRAQRASARISAIEPRLTRLYVRMPGRPEPGMTVHMDGVELPRSAYATGVPLDPGSHVVTARVPGRPAWTRRISAGPGSQRIEVEVPLLHAERRRPTQGPSSERAQWATVLLAGGGGAIVAGLIAGGIAWHRDGQADELCASDRCTDARAVDASTQARSAAAVATVAIGAGFALGIAGGVLLWTAPDAGDTAGLHWRSRW